MPSRNTIKIDVPESYYHVYARGASNKAVFLEPSDFDYFIGLFSRYLSKKQMISKEGVPYPHYINSIELLAFCLVPNHFHLLIYQKDQGSMAALMRSIMTSYSRHFNLKYKRTGSLFESRYKASRIDADNYLIHISRYIHLNTRYWKRYAYSSYRYYANSAPEWLNTKRILGIFSDKNDFTQFHEDYEDYKVQLDEIKHELANQ